MLMIKWLFCNRDIGISVVVVDLQNQNQQSSPERWDYENEQDFFFLTEMFFMSFLFFQLKTKLIDQPNKEDPKLQNLSAFLWNANITFAYFYCLRMGAFIPQTWHSGFSCYWLIYLQIIWSMKTTNTSIHWNFWINTNVILIVKMQKCTSP